MDEWAKNLEIVRRRFPVLAARLEEARAIPAPAAFSAGESQCLARRWLQGRRIRNGAMLAVSGFGDGRHVRALLEQLPPGATVFVGEAEPAALRHALENEPLGDLLADARLLLGAGEIDDGFFSPLENFPVIEIADVEPYLFAPLFNPAPKWYGQFFTEFARQIDFRHRLHGTLVADAELWQANTFQNLPLLAEAPDIAALVDAFRGLPMVIVSAGPSLDESLDFLREASKRAVVVAVNSSYRAVRAAGIVPSLVLAADPREFTTLGFRGVPVDGSYLVTNPIVHPEVPPMFRHRTFTWSGANALMTEIRRRCGLPPGSTIVEQGTISACAVDLAWIMGCDRVCLVGQDLAVAADGRSHAQNSFYSDLGTNRADLTACRRLPGNTQPEVFVEEKLFVYLKTFEQLAIHRPHLRFLNTSRLGAAIPGIPYADFAHALRWLGKGNATGTRAVLAARLKSGRKHALDLAKAQRALQPTRAFAEKILTEALRSARAFEQCPAELLAEEGADSPQIASLLEMADGLRASLDGMPEERAILEAGRTRLELFRQRSVPDSVRNGPEHARRILREREFVWAIAEGAWFLSSCLVKCCGYSGSRGDGAG